MFQQYDEQTASTEDRIAWALCQIIDDDAPMLWTRYRFVAECIAGNEKLMADLKSLGEPGARHPTLEECEKAGIGPVNVPGKGYSEGGLPNTAEERARFEAYMRGHCWDFGAFDAKTNSYDTVEVRRLYGVWRDRGWLAMKAAQPQQATAADALRRDNDNLRTVMIAAAEEIHAHWDAHCDAEGYGPANLMHRLEEGIPSEYGYTAGAFAALKAAQADEIAAAVAFERERCAALCEMWNTSPGSSLAKEIRGSASAAQPQQAEPVASIEGLLPSGWEAEYARFRDGPAFPPYTPALKVAFAAGAAWGHAQPQQATGEAAVLAKVQREPVAWRWKERINDEFDSGWRLTSFEPPTGPRTIAIEPLYNHHAQPRKRTEQDAWEDWAAKVRPAGDVDEVQRRWLASPERRDFMDEDAQPSPLHNEGPEEKP